MSTEKGKVEGDLVADSETLDVDFLKEVKSKISRGFLQASGGQLMRTGDPMLLAVIELDEPEVPLRDSDQPSQ